MAEQTQQRQSSQPAQRLGTVQGGTTHAQQEIASLGPWFHNLHLADGTQTAADHPLGDFPATKWREISRYLPDDLAGRRVLDIGCNAGFYSFALAARGADVLGIDHDDRYLRQARWASRRMNHTGSVRFSKMSAYSLNHLPDRYDIVWFMGVFYHLRYPMLGLDLAAQKARQLLVFQSMSLPEKSVGDVPEDLPIASRGKMLEPGWPRMAFVEHAVQGDSTNWWVPNHACILAMLRSAGLDVVDQPCHEVYLCSPQHG